MKGKGTELLREESTPISISGHFEARRAQSVSAPLHFATSISNSRFLSAAMDDRSS